MIPDRERSYANVFDGALAPVGDVALLVVDAVNAYVEPGSPLYVGDEGALESLARLIAAARRAGAPVIFTNVAYRADGSDGGLFYRKVPALACFTPGSTLGGFPERIRPLPGELVVTKQYPSAFFGTQLAATLHDRGIGTLVIGGYSTSGCVRASAVDALCHGFVPFVVREACGDRHPAPHDANLFDLQAKYAEVIDETTAVGLLVPPLDDRIQRSQLDGS